jgi:dTDP-glucose 4,6-dehydratase
VNRKDRFLGQLNGRLETLTKRVDLTPLSGKHIFLTGCTGFVGAWLLHTIVHLNQHGAEIRATALTRDPKSFASRHPRLSKANWLSLLTGDTTSFVVPSFSADLIILGAAPVTPEALSDNESTRRTIIEGCKHVLAQSKTFHTRRILCLSSGAVYGDQPENAKFPVENNPCNPSAGDTYAEAKLVMEAQTLAHGRHNSVDTIVARLFTFSGPWLPSHLAFAQFMRMAIAGRPIALSSDGSPVRSYLYGGDMAVWLLALLSHAPNGTISNVGSDIPISLKQLADMISQRFSQAHGVIVGVGSSSSRNTYVPNITLARQQFGLDTWTPLELALNDYFDWLTPIPPGSMP